MNQKKIGSFIKELRQSHSLTQEELAQILGVNHRTVSRWETGKNMPDYDVIIDMAKYFQVNVDEILNGERQVTQQKSRFLKNKYAIMNNMNYHVVNFVFNIVSILMIIIALSGFIYFLVFYVYESAWLVAFVNIFLNMFLFHWLYVMRFHNEVDRIWTYQKKSCEH